MADFPSSPETATLLPCPFCKSIDLFVEREDFTSSYVMCNSCGARGPAECTDDPDEETPGEAAARKIWNTRGLAQTPAGPREVLRSVCHAGGELGCSCADQNYQWFDHACREQIVSTFKKMLNAEAALSDTSTDRTSK